MNNRQKEKGEAQKKKMRLPVRFKKEPALVEPETQGRDARATILKQPCRRPLNSTNGPGAHRSAAMRTPQPL